MPRVGLFGDDVAFETTILLQVILINSLIHQAGFEQNLFFDLSLIVLFTCVNSSLFTLSKEKLYIHDIAYCDSVSLSLSNDHLDLFHLPL